MSTGVFRAYPTQPILRQNTTTGQPLGSPPSSPRMDQAAYVRTTSQPQSLVQPIAAVIPVVASIPIASRLPPPSSAAPYPLTQEVPIYLTVGTPLGVPVHRGGPLVMAAYARLSAMAQQPEPAVAAIVPASAAVILAVPTTTVPRPLDVRVQFVPVPFTIAQSLDSPPIWGSGPEIENFLRLPYPNQQGPTPTPLITVGTPLGVPTPQTIIRPEAYVRVIAPVQLPEEFAVYDQFDTVASTTPLVWDHVARMMQHPFASVVVTLPAPVTPPVLPTPLAFLPRIPYPTQIVQTLIPQPPPATDSPSVSSVPQLASFQRLPWPYPVVDYLFTPGAIAFVYVAPTALPQIPTQPRWSYSVAGPQVTAEAPTAYIAPSVVLYPSRQSWQVQMPASLFMSGQPLDAPIPRTIQSPSAYAREQRARYQFVFPFVSYSAPTPTTSPIEVRIVVNLESDKIVVRMDPIPTIITSVRE